MLNIHDLHFSYGQHAVLNGLSYELFLGEIVGFGSDNGAGRITTLSIISGLYETGHRRMERHINLV